MYRVIYSPPAEQDLATVWIAAPDRAAVNAATARIERLLADDPLRHSKYLSEQLWLCIELPVAVYFQVDPRTNVVWVTDVVAAEERKT